MGKVAPPPVHVGDTRGKINNLNEGRNQNTGAAAKALSDDPKGFAYLKRDLVRLLGILVYRSRAVQDRVRLCGGIPVVLNLCVIDERNPCTCFRIFLRRPMWRVIAVRILIIISGVLFGHFLSLLTSVHTHLLRVASLPRLLH